MYSNHQARSAHLAATPMLSAHESAQKSIINPLELGKGSVKAEQKQRLPLLLLLCAVSLLPGVQGCEVFSKTEAEAQSRPPGRQREGSTAPVEVAIAKTGVLQEPLEYTGSTTPVREISLRAQVEGRLLKLQADVGDPVKQGQILAQLDDSILVTDVTQAQAELAALQSEVTRAQSQVRNAQAQAEQAKAELQQARVDAARLQSLQNSGAIPKQDAERAQTAAATAQQKYSSALAQITTEEQAVAAAQGRVAAQRAAVAQTQERQSYTLLASPITGVVLAKVSEPGNLIQPGGEVVRLGDFSSVKVVVPVSELELSNIRVGQTVQVRLDAFPNEELSGKVTRISPAADVSARQIPIEITIPNSNGRIGSGLLARVSFESKTTARVVVPQTAIEEESKGRGRGDVGTRDAHEAQKGENPNPKLSEATLFVVTGRGSDVTVQARRVQIGDRINGQVEILSGLQPGERFVARSGRPLKNGEKVRLSVLSQTEKQEQR